ncbi:MULTISPECIES: helix-turn-helix domain-containing protein [Niastella]|uniref:Helix-turn-helix transcriptional regulator n=1 Tax=Niastella soli TaxID=2821487 RepID=A0ABS3Z1V6_9BACT|nr:AraC family transcriptional regulator [Niastella soli]MBO9203396.1 helix-turn-helix transcriptional regulator [Niastella soli]
MLTQKVKTWLSQFKQYYFTYSKGFYHLPCNVNSPQKLINSFEKFPFVKHSLEKQFVSSNNPFCSGGFYYHKLEEGCWIVFSKMRYKANVAFDLMYDTPTPGPMTADDYYMLSLNNITNVVPGKNALCGKSINFPRFSWVFFKPRERNCDLNFKGSNNQYLTLYFNEAWLQKNLMPNKLFTEGKLDSFIRSDAGYIVWPLEDGKAALSQFDRFNVTMNIGGNAQEIDFLNLKFCTLELIFDFFKLCREDEIVSRHVLVDYTDKFNMNKVEHYLSNHLFEKFPGIDLLARKFNLSETKLKVEFKQLFGKPVYQYFQEKQMELAKELLMENQLLIKEISWKFGYESTSKFSAAFKKHHGVLPSELSKVTQ